MSTISEFTYPYNPNGVLTECNVTDESHTITPVGDRNYNWFVPYSGPFFGFSMVVRHVASGKTLQRGVDYNFGLEYHVFNTQVTLRPVYGAIVLIDTALTGQFEIDYMTIGGQYAIDQNKALALLANAQLDPRQTYWENVTDIPSQFPVTQHLHNVSDITGMADVVLAIQALEAAFKDTGGKWYQALAEHLLDRNDPHHVLDMIPGGGGTAIPKATQQQAYDGTNNDAYMTPLRTKQYSDQNVIPVITQLRLDSENALTAFGQQTGNVFNMVPADIDLGEVVNMGQATVTEYQTAGAVPTKYVNVALLRQVLVSSGAVTAQQVDQLIDTAMGDITRYPIAAQDDEGSGNKLTTPAFVMHALDNYELVVRMGVCEGPVDRQAYLAQTVHTENMVDLATDQVYVFDENTSGWVLDDTNSTATALVTNHVYFNQVSGKTFWCADADDEDVVKLADNRVTGSTISNTAAPTDTTGYSEGHVWYQID